MNFRGKGRKLEMLYFVSTTMKGHETILRIETDIFCLGRGTIVKL